jgi:hypothetical protein
MISKGMLLEARQFFVRVADLPKKLATNDKIELLGYY